MKKLSIADFQDIGGLKSIFVNEFRAGIRIFPIPSEYSSQNDYYKDSPFEFHIIDDDYLFHSQNRDRIFITTMEDGLLYSDYIKINEFFENNA